MHQLAIAFISSGFPLQLQLIDSNLHFIMNISLNSDLIWARALSKGIYYLWFSQQRQMCDMQAAASPIAGSLLFLLLL